MTDADKLALALSGKSVEQIRAEIERFLKARMKETVDKPLDRRGVPTKRAMEMQADYLAGAMTALQAVFATPTDELSPVSDPRWVWKTLRGELVVDVREWRQEPPPPK